MRRLAIGLALLVAILVAGLVLAVMNVNGLLEENRERLSQLASDATRMCSG